MSRVGRRKRPIIQVQQGNLHCYSRVRTPLLRIACAALKHTPANQCLLRTPRMLLPQGFTMMTITLAILAGCYNLLRDNCHWAFLCLCEHAGGCMRLLPPHGPCMHPCLRPCFAPMFATCVLPPGAGSCTSATLPTPSL